MAPQKTSVSSGGGFQENIKDLHTKYQVWIEKLQSCPEKYNMGYIMYIAHNIQVQDIIRNVLKTIEQKNVHKVDIAIASEATFQTEADRKLFYKNFNKHDKDQCTSHNHMKVTTIYCGPRLKILLFIHLLRYLLSESNPKYLTSG